MKTLLCVGMLGVVTIAATAQQPGKDTTAKVEVGLAAQNVPDGLKTGSRADLVMVMATTVTATGKVSVATAPLVAGTEVLSIKREEKPADPLQAVRVQLRVTKEQAAKIEKAKARVATVVERVNGKAVTTKRPIPLRLELVQPAKE